MKVVFVVQGEGRGHMTQAITMKELLCSNGHEVTKVLVGRSKSRTLPDFFRRNIGAEVKTFYSPNFLPKPDNKRSSVSHSLTYNIRMLPEYKKSMCFIADEIENSGADLVINFYEILTGMAYLFLSPSVPYVCIGHQYLFMHEGFAFPHGKYFSRLGLLFFTRLTCMRASRKLALSFCEMPDDTTHDIKVVPPLLRKEVKRLKTTDGDFVHGYMVNSGAGISADDFDISRLISFADTFKPNNGFWQWANNSEFMFLPILLAASATRKRYSQRLYDHLLQPVMRYLLA